MATKKSNEGNPNAGRGTGGSTKNPPKPVGKKVLDMKTKKDRCGGVTSLKPGKKKK